MAKKAKVLITGPYIRNIGGISIHLRRLVELLENDLEFDFVDEGHTRYDQVFNLRSLNVFKYFRLVRGADVVHIHSGHWLLRSLHMLMCKFFFRKKTIVTIHRNPAVEPLRGLTKYLLRRCDHVVFVNQEGYDLMAGSHTPGQSMVMPAFLPPVIDVEPELPKKVTDWVQQARQHPDSKLVVSNAWNLVINDGQDLYGVDMAIDAAKRLREKGYNNIFFVFVVATCTNQQDLLAHYQSLISENNLGGRFLLWTEPLSFVRLLTHSDIMLRATNTDGDAISVREALCLGKAVLASDVVERPKGTHLFKNRDLESMVDAMINMSEQADVRIVAEQTDYRMFYLQLYTK